MPYKITLVGSGNTAWNIGHALHQHGQTVLQVISQNIDHARELAGKLKAASSDKLSEIDPASDIVLLCVKDEAIAEVAAQINLNRQLVAHCSGSIPMDVLAKTSNRFGVFYPLQTLSKKALRDFRQVPLCVEGCTNETEEILFTLADSLSNIVHRINSAQRLYLHLAAVIANNFTNYLYSVAKEITDTRNIPFDLLKPLILETAKNIQQHDPASVQTGPAMRHDKVVIQKHLDLLASHTQLQQLYKLITEQIQKQHE